VSACKFGRFLSILAFLLVTLSFFEIPMGQILAPTAIGALALSFASKDVLSNVFGGVMVMCDRPFAVGDYVKIANTDEGTVRYIGWRMTEVALRNGRILHVPNGLVTTSTVTNYSEKTHWFVQKEIGIRYQDLPVAKDVANAIEKWINEHALTNQRRVSFARVYNFADSSVTIRVRVYLKSSINTKQWYIFTEELLMKVCEVVNSHGADFAFPTRTVIMDGQNTEQMQ
jgi:MscS family membrane protein